ncbi:MAG: ABC transporter ATP-binding protein [Candidatus Eremiobacteraeota bacterium]|nr:ABC transporter ATP-binding protein [Candidatus Eremiobacteraeota bacterium]
MLEVKDLYKTYKYANVKIHAVNDVSFNIRTGDIVSIFGRSGSGKTTLLNLIGTLDRPDSGEIIINGKNTREVSGSKLAAFRRSNIGFVFQYFNLIPYLTAIENVALPLKFDGVARSERNRRAKEVLEEIGLSKRLDFKLAGLSGGQVQRVAFARAIIAKPRIVLADEPTGQLDSKTAENLAETIVNLNKKSNITFIITTHDPVISSIANKIIYFEDGKIQKKE